MKTVLLVLVYLLLLVYYLHQLPHVLIGQSPVHVEPVPGVKDRSFDLRWSWTKKKNTTYHSTHIQIKWCQHEWTCFIMFYHEGHQRVGGGVAPRSASLSDVSDDALNEVLCWGRRHLYRSLIIISVIMSSVSSTTRTDCNIVEVWEAKTKPDSGLLMRVAMGTGCATCPPGGVVQSWLLDSGVNVYFYIFISL